PHGLELVGLAVPVAADQGGHPGSVLELEQRPRAVVEKSQVTQVRAGAAGGRRQPGRRTGMRSEVRSESIGAIAPAASGSGSSSGAGRSTAGRLGWVKPNATRDEWMLPRPSRR